MQADRQELPSVEEIREQLDVILSERSYPLPVKVIGFSIVAAAFTVFLSGGLTVQVDLVIIGALMNLVPGVAITNSMHDIIAGDLVAGLAKLIEALIIGTAIALGTGLSFVIASFL